MTVALGLVCTDGVVVASDSMGSSEHDTASESVKVHAVTGLPVIWTSSGTVFVKEEVERAIATKWNPGNAKIRNAFGTPDLNGVRDIIQREGVDAVGSAYANALPLGRQMVNQQSGRHVFHTSFLFLGWASDTPWFLEFDGQGQLNWHTEARIKAIGSGGAFADVAGALMSHYLDGEDLSVELGKRVAYRAIEATCQVSSQYVAEPVQLAVVDSTGARVLTPEEVLEVKHAVTGWKQMERELLVGEIPTVDSPDVDPPSLQSA